MATPDELGCVRVMDSSIIALIFVSVFGGIAILYCLFRVLGGRIADCLSCNFCRGPCCDCFGVGGRADASDFEVLGYPPGYQSVYPPLSGLDRQWQPQPPQQPQPQPIVIVNRTGGGSSSSETSSDSDSDDGAYTHSKRNRKRNRESKRPRAEAAVYTRHGREYDSLREQSGLGGGPSGGVVVV